MDRARATVRLGHLSPPTERAYVAGIRRFIHFHDKRHPLDMGAVDVTTFPSAWATRQQVSASTQNQALSALLFLYREVLRIELPWLDEVARAKRPKRLPVLLSARAVSLVLAPLRGSPWLKDSLLYGSAPRLMECARLRVMDLDIERREILVRDSKGRKERRTILPTPLVGSLQTQLARVRHLHETDLSQGAGWVELPNALTRKLRLDAQDWPWQCVLAATRTYRYRARGAVRRHHLDDSVLQKEVGGAMQRGPGMCQIV